MQLKSRFLFLLLITITTSPLFAKWRLPKLFTDNMVIQRDQPVLIWGWADPGEKIRISFNGQQADATTDANGNWKVQLSPMAYGGPFPMQISSPAGSKVLENILIGDVWVCSGQSNMEMPLAGWGRISNYEKEIAAANYPGIRLFTVEKATSYTPEKEVKGGNWQTCSPSTISEFSATAYFFGRQLNKELHIPIGLINATWGGTNVQTWASWDAMQQVAAYKNMNQADFPALEASWEKNRATYQETLQHDPGVTESWFLPATSTSSWKPIVLPVTFEHSDIGNVDGIVWFRKQVTLTTAQAAQKATLSLGVIDDYDEAYVNGKQVGKTADWTTSRNYILDAGSLQAGINTIVVKVKDGGGGGGFVSDASTFFLQTGTDKVSIAGKWLYKPAVTTGQFNVTEKGPNALPSQLYNAMIAPLVNYSIKGAIWYQGEQNTLEPDSYHSLFPILIKDWRNKWGKAFPFYWVQLANYMQPVDLPANSAWATVREGQHMALQLPQTGEALAIDLGEAGDIHPKDKQDVGYRLALVALQKTYGKTIVSSGPVFQFMQVKEGKALLSFTSTGSGLVAKGDKYGYVKGFAIAGKDGRFVWAKAAIKGSQVIVSSEQVATPVAVRYAWADNPADANLYNKEGLPASPFRTDTPSK
jgi:sialate O-acetylesterase